MKLSKEEAICFVLFCSEKYEVSSITKLNKLLARLNLYFIPVDIDFSLNKYGSYNADLEDIKENEYYGIKLYTIEDKEGKRLYLKKEGLSIVKEFVKPKLDKILNADEFENLRETIYNLSLLSAKDISENEHRLLLVDIDEKFKLDQRINENLTDMFDLYSQIDTIEESSIANIKLKALIEYCYYLMKYLRNMRFRVIPDEYDNDAYMLDYYYLFLIHNKLVPFFHEQIKKSNKDELMINKYYQYIINSVRGRYPFSLDNRELKNLIK